MDQQIIDLVRRTAQASVRYVAMAGIALVVLTLLSKIPFLGGLFACFSVLGVLALAAGIAYLITPKITPLPYGQTKPMLALWIGVGVAVPLTIAITIARIVGSVFDVFIQDYTLIGGIFHIVGAVLIGLIGGLLLNIALAWLGSFFSIDRNPSLAGVQGPPSAGRPF